MYFSSIPGKSQHMAQALKERIPVNAHDGQHAQGQKRHCHDNDFDGARHGQPHQLRVARQYEQQSRFNGVAKFQHPAQYLPGIRVVCRDGVHVVVTFFVHCHLPIL